MKLFSRQLGDSGEPLIVLHGLFGSSDNWLTLSREWKKNNQLFLLDLRNHGKSPHTAEFDYSVMSQDVNEFMIDHEIRRAVLMGHSMGGKVAMTLAINHPQKISKLIVVDVAPKPYRSSEFIAIIDHLLRMDIQLIKTREAADESLAEQISAPLLRRFLLKNLSRDREGNFYWRVNLQAVQQNLDLIAGNIPVEGNYEGPTLFLSGENSNYIGKADLGNIKTKFPCSEVRKIANAGHWIHVDNPQEVSTAVKKFISFGD